MLLFAVVLQLGSLNFGTNLATFPLRAKLVNRKTWLHAPGSVATLAFHKHNYTYHTTYHTVLNIQQL